MKLFRNFFTALIRKQSMEMEGGHESRLNRCLSTFDLTLLGVGSTLGLGIYVIAGQVASTKAGPAVIISFFIAAVASVFAGLCYAEFGARVPRAGSAYIYSYVTVGELMAFIIGWNLILEYVIGAASVARGYSSYIDSLTGNAVEKYFTETIPLNVPNISPYPDFMAFGIIIVLTLTLCLGVQLSSKFNNVFTAVNLLIVLYVVICGAFKADIKNWNLHEGIPENGGVGGFMPYGVSGMMSGAATCFYAFIGFDVIATTGEEVKNPQKSIPISIVLSLLFVFLAYFGVSGIQTLMWPYYDQDNSAPLPYVFERAGWPVAKMVISVGALAGLSTSLLCAMFPLPRIFYAMGSDGLVYKFLAKIHPRFQTPLIATIFSGLFAGVMAMLFDVSELADMMSIGTLLAYSLVALSVLILRYKCDDVIPSGLCASDTNLIGSKTTINGNICVGNDSVMKSSVGDIVRQLVNWDDLKKPSPLSSIMSLYMIIVTSLLLVILDALITYAFDQIANVDIAFVVLISVVVFAIFLLIFCLNRQPSSTVALSFKVPLVPFIPYLSIGINIYLMFQLNQMTWIRFAVWMAVGLTIYFTYGMWHSTLRFSQNPSEVKSYTNEVALEGKETGVSCISNSSMDKKDLTRL